MTGTALYLFVVAYSPQRRSVLRSAGGDLSTYPEGVTYLGP